MSNQPANPVDDACFDSAAESFANTTLPNADTSDSGGTAPLAEQNRAKEYGGRDGLDPVRYGDWEKNGRCIDF